MRKIQIPLSTYALVGADAENSTVKKNYCYTSHVRNGRRDYHQNQKSVSVSTSSTHKETLEMIARRSSYYRLT